MSFEAVRRASWEMDSAPRKEAQAAELEALAEDTKYLLTVVAFNGRLLSVTKSVGRLETLPRHILDATWRLPRVALLFMAKVSDLSDVL